MLKLGQETTKVIDGTSYTFGRVTIGLVEQFAAWVRDKEGDPFELADRYLDKLPREEWEVLFKEARQKRDELQAFTLDSAVAQKWLKTPEGAAQLFYLLLKERQPTITPSEAFEVFLALGFEEAQELLDKGAGEPPAKIVRPPVL